EFGMACRTDPMDKALKAADDFKQIFGAENFFLEVQNHGLDEEKKIFEGAVAAGRDLGLRLVATNNVHYMARDDDKAHDALLALGAGKLVSDPDRLRYPTPEFYLKSPEEMSQAFTHCPEALKTSVDIAERCNLELRFNEIHLLRFALPEGKEKTGDYLRSSASRARRRNTAIPSATTSASAWSTSSASWTRWASPATSSSSGTCAGSRSPAACASAPAAARPPARSSATCSTSRPSTRSATVSSSSGSSTPRARRCPTSTSTSPTRIAAASSSTSSTSTATTRWPRSSPT